MKWNVGGDTGEDEDAMDVCTAGTRYSSTHGQCARVAVYVFWHPMTSIRPAYLCQGITPGK